VKNEHPGKLWPEFPGLFHFAPFISCKFLAPILSSALRMLVFSRMIPDKTDEQRSVPG
jgi:hypothetical protein